MPRLPPSLFHEARRIDQLLPLLLPATRDLSAARNELRWIREHVHQAKGQAATGTAEQRTLQACKERGRGRPLQYVLGSEYFGDLELLCQPGVLIPRQETAAYTTFLASMLSELWEKPHLRVLDLCTGSGCIPLLLHHELAARKKITLESLGVDISPTAVSLARRNAEKQRCQANAHFLLGTIFHDRSTTLRSRLPSVFDLLNSRDGLRPWDVLISNPPYISPEDFNRTTARSVRNYEPKLALVPDRSLSTRQAETGDIFYSDLIKLAHQVKPSIILLEIGDHRQASRVAAMLQEDTNWKRIEIWRDQPEMTSNAEESRLPVPVRGQGNARSVFACTGPLMERWRSSSLWI